MLVKNEHLPLQPEMQSDFMGVKYALLHMHNLFLLFGDISEL